MQGIKLASSASSRCGVRNPAGRLGFLLLSASPSRYNRAEPLRSRLRTRRLALAFSPRTPRHPTRPARPTAVLSPAVSPTPSSSSMPEAQIWKGISKHSSGALGRVLAHMPCTLPAGLASGAWASLLTKPLLQVWQWCPPSAATTASPRSTTRWGLAWPCGALLACLALNSAGWQLVQSALPPHACVHVHNIMHRHGRSSTWSVQHPSLLHCLSAHRTRGWLRTCTPPPPWPPPP